MVWGCYDNQETPSNAVARVGKHILTIDEVIDNIPENVSDSALNVYAQRYVDEWISSQLIYDQARKNLPNTAEIEEMVEAYRRDLYSYEYRKRLCDEQLQEELPEDTIMAFYNAHRSEFILHKNIAKGILLKVPAEAPQVPLLRKWVADAATSGVENIEKYAVKNAIGYDYFLDRWTYVDDIKDNIPYEFTDEKKIIKNHSTFEHKSNDIIYMLCIDSCLYAGDIMPYEFARQRIYEILSNEQRVTFNKELEQALYNEAIKKGGAERLYNDNTFIKNR